MSVRSVIACLCLLSGTVVCPWWTHLFPMYTHHNLIVLFVLNLSFISILPPSVPRSVKSESERNMNLSGYAYFNIMHISSPDVIFANFCTWATLTSLIVGQVWYRSADKFLARPGRKQARKYVRDASDFSNIETRALIKFFFLQGKAPKEIYAIVTKTLACFLPGRAKDLSASLCIKGNHFTDTHCTVRNYCSFLFL
jgi:hypothetical protein